MGGEVPYLEEGNLFGCVMGNWILGVQQPVWINAAFSGSLSCILRSFSSEASFAWEAENQG